METIAYLNVDSKSIYTQNGFLHFTGREDNEEAHTHHLNLTSIKRWKFLNDTLTVYFKAGTEALMAGVGDYPQDTLRPIVAEPTGRTGGIPFKPAKSPAEDVEAE